MKLTPVKSSNITAVGYIAPKKTLHVKFTNGSLYEYHNVPQGTVEDLLNSKSLGSFFRKSVARVYPYHKIDDTASCTEQCPFLVREGVDLACSKFSKPLTLGDNEKAERLEECDEQFVRQEKV